MSSDKKTKLNRLLKRWPRGTVAVASFLDAAGFSHQLRGKYKKGSWIESFGRGAYVLSGDKVQWPGALYALQTQLDMEVHAGGKTALEMKGYAHFLPMERQHVFLYGPRGVSLPSWFQGERLGVEMIFTRTNLFPPGTEDGFTQYEVGEFTVRISAPERAAMEMLHLVPKRVGFEEAMLVMENLATLRPEVVQSLLEACRSVKVKRLFLYMAEHHGHAWADQLDHSNLDLGRGKRAIVPGGKLDKKYEITVPKLGDHLGV
jgi:hypothetical protein